MKTKCYLFILSFSLSFCTHFILAHKSDLKREQKILGLSTTNKNLISVPTDQLKSSLSQLSLNGVTPPLMQSDSPKDSDVSVTCSTSDFVLRVRRAFYGLGADEQELTLGRSCKSNGDPNARADLIFSYSLTSCDAVRELQPGFLVYKYVLHYKPSEKRFPSRAQSVDVNIECHYQRDYSVRQLAVQPTWQTIIVRKALKEHLMDFQIKLMDESWEPKSKASEYLLGRAVNVQVSNPHLSAGEKLYINVCYATPSTGSKPSLRYTIIDNFGCMLDSKLDPGASEFVSRTNKSLRFSFKAFQFTTDPNTEISIHCKLIVTSEDPGPVHKSCTYKNHRWRALTGPDSICDCCESKCVTSKQRRALKEGSASSGPLLVSDQPRAEEDDLSPLRSFAPSWKEEIEIEEEIESPAKIWKNGNVEMHVNEERTNKLLEKHTTVMDTLTEPDKENLNHKGRLSEEERSGHFPKNVGTGGDEDFAAISGNPKICENQEEEELLRCLEQIEPTESSKKTEFFNCEQENEKHGCGGKNETTHLIEQNSDSSLADQKDEEEKTWYFSWR